MKKIVSFVMLLIFVCNLTICSVSAASYNSVIICYDEDIKQGDTFSVVFRVFLDGGTSTTATVKYDDNIFGVHDDSKSLVTAPGSITFTAKGSKKYVDKTIKFIALEDGKGYIKLTSNKIVVNGKTVNGQTASMRFTILEKEQNNEIVTDNTSSEVKNESSVNVSDVENTGEKESETDEEGSETTESNVDDAYHDSGTDHTWPSDDNDENAIEISSITLVIACIIIPIALCGAFFTGKAIGYNMAEQEFDLLYCENYSLPKNSMRIGKINEEQCNHNSKK